MDELKMELIQINEAMEMIAHSLDTFGHDPELVEQLGNLIKERDALRECIDSLQ